MYKFICQHNDYQNYRYVETKTFQTINHIKKSPKELKLFVNDIFDYDNDFSLVHSNFRSNKMNPGILNLSITYGKENNKKFLYLCKPDDKRIPFFLIPYNKPLEFDKSIQNIYITFEFKHWDYEHPYGIISQNLGNICILNNYYEYILYCKSLNISIQKFTKEVKQKLQLENNKNIIEKIVNKYNLEIRHKSNYIFTLDTEQSNDYDDALSYDKNENKISIYISNVAMIMDELDLWDAFSNRISTIYLPDKKRTMLPSLLIDALCSLKEKQYKLCYYLDIFYNDKNEYKTHKFGICSAYIRKNINYNNNDFFETNESFKQILKILKIKHSKQVVTRLMLMFNHYAAKEMWIKEQGIFKVLHQDDLKDNIPNNIPKDIYEHICIIKNKASNYSTYNPNIIYKSSTHKEIDLYTQLTSPIRRLVDLLNNIKLLQYVIDFQLSEKSIFFYNKWTTNENMEYINISSRAIRKIQSKCLIYKKYEENKKNNYKPLYKGYVFDKAYKQGDGKFHYMVYIPNLQLTTYVTLIEDLENYSNHCFSLYVFMSEENDKKKIKLQLCYEKI